jgi:chromosome segregation ATPase
MCNVSSDFARKLKYERDEAQKELSSVYQWIERNHADGFIDSLSYFQNLERVTDSWYDRLDRMEREREEVTKDLEFRRGLYKVQEQYLETARRERDEAREQANHAIKQRDEAREYADRLEKSLDKARAELTAVTEQRDEARADLEFRRGLDGARTAFVVEARRELDEARKEIDNIRKMLSESGEAIGNGVHDYSIIEMVENLIQSKNYFIQKSDSVERERDEARGRLKRLEQLALAVVQRWDQPSWKDAEPTAAVIYKLRDALGVEE